MHIRNLCTFAAYEGAVLLNDWLRPINVLKSCIYMRQPGINVNASLYDIKAFFKGRDEKGRMNATSKDEHFNALMVNLRVTLQNLAKKIEIKVYVYGFLK